MRKFLPFENYFAPKTQEQALELLQALGAEARMVAGGTDLFVAMREKGFRTKALIDIKGIDELRGIAPLNGAGLSIAAATPLHQIEMSPLVRQLCPVLIEAVGTIGSLQVRNRGTIGGNVVNASPAADSVPALLVLDAKVEMVGSSGSREVPLQSFFTGPGKTVMQPNEILRRVLIPKPEPGQFSVYLKFGPRRAMDIAVVGVAASLIFGRNGSCEQARIALGAVAPIPLRAPRSEAALLGKIDEAVIAHAAGEAMAEASPISDVRASAEYRRHLIGVLVRRAVNQVISLYQGVPLRQA
jgi:carbon-monoxide dehydrogenase medium subunit